MSIDDITLFEAGETSDQFTLTLSEAATEDVVVQWSVADATATFGDDYTGAPPVPSSGQTTIAAGDTEAQLDPDDYRAVDDDEIEGNETFEVTLTSVSGGGAVLGGKTVGTGTIVDNDSLALDCGYTWGDPHYVTADGLKYDMQGCGEFVLVETVGENDPDPVMVQTRTERYGPNLSINTAVATEVDGYRDHHRYERCPAPDHRRPRRRRSCAALGWRTRRRGAFGQRGMCIP